MNKNFTLNLFYQTSIEPDYYQKIFKKGLVFQYTSIYDFAHYSSKNDKKHLAEKKNWNHRSHFIITKVFPGLRSIWRQA